MRMSDWSSDVCYSDLRGCRALDGLIMYVFYEEDGGFKAANILSETDASLQVESESGKRNKIKRANMLFTFAEPAQDALVAQATQAAAARDLQFLWEIGRASCGERGGKYAEIPVVEVPL